MNSENKFALRSFGALLLLSVCVTPFVAAAQIDYGSFDPTGSLGGGGIDSGSFAPTGDLGNTGNYGGGIDYGQFTPTGNLGSNGNVGSNLGYGDTGTYGGVDYGQFTPTGNLGSAGNYGIDYGPFVPSGGSSVGSNLGYGDTTNGGSGYDLTSTPTYSYTPGYDLTSTPTYGYSLGYTNPVSGYSVGAVPTSGYSIGYTNPMGGNVQTQNQSQGQSQSSTNNNTNTNANTVTSTNTNNNNSSASASTGPISINNVNNNVVNVPGPQVISAPQQPHYPAPSCSMTVTRQGVLAGYYANQPMTLTWNSSNGTSAYISPSVGTVAPSGTTTVYPNGYTSYTMTVYGPGGTGTCYANAYGYSAPVSYVSHPVYTAPVVTSPSVSLNQIPYTGYDFGTVGDSIYWSVLFLFAAAAGYLMVYYQGGMLELASAMVRGNTNYSVVAEEDEEEAEEVNDIESEDSYTVPTIGDLSRMTTDAMIMQRGTSNAAPRIVIARA